MKKSKGVRKFNGIGEECPRCGWISQEREHANLDEVRKKKTTYYIKWFYCINPRCKTNVFFNEIYKVKGNSVYDGDLMSRFKAVKEQLSGDKHWRGF